MTETAWRNTDDVKWRLCFLQTRVSERKLALFQIACCDALWAQWDSSHPVRQFLPTTLAIIDGTFPHAIGFHAQALREHLEVEQTRLSRFVEENRGKMRQHVIQQSKETVAAALLWYAITPEERWWATTCDIDDGLLAAQYAAFDGRLEHVCRENLDLLLDIVGDPFHPIAFDPTWRTDTVVSLARVMYESRDFSPMPILADALQDAGCENAEVVSHCRDPNGIHVRGCWVVDLVLGKG